MTRSCWAAIVKWCFPHDQNGFRSFIWDNSSQKSDVVNLIEQKRITHTIHPSFQTEDSSSAFLFLHYQIPERVTTSIIPQHHDLIPFPWFYEGMYLLCNCYIEWESINRHKNREGSEEIESDHPTQLLWREQSCARRSQPIDEIRLDNWRRNLSSLNIRKRVSSGIIGVRGTPLITKGVSEA
jgi:hypothetical protein